MKKVWITLLLLLTLTISVLWHLPTSWLLSQKWSTQYLPSSVTLLNPAGYWWNGSTQLKLNYNHQQIPLGRVTWKWQPLYILTENLSIKIALTSQAYQLTTRLNQSRQSFNFENLQGQINLTKMQSMFPEQFKTFGSIKGSLQIQNFNISLPLSQNMRLNYILWPKQLEGQIQIRHLNLLGANISTLKLVPTLEKNMLRLSIQGSNPHWNLKGDALLTQNYDYSTNLTLVSDSPQTLPGWQSLFMKQLSPTQANAKLHGNLHNLQ